MYLTEFQWEVDDWLEKCFGGTHGKPPQTVSRAYRFVEEALELAQAVGVTKEQVTELLDYVYSRPAGETHVEIGDVLLTLTSLTSALDQCLMQNAKDVIKRAHEKITIIREKDNNKLADSPLPGVSFVSLGNAAPLMRIVIPVEWFIVDNDGHLQLTNEVPEDESLVVYRSFDQLAAEERYRQMSQEASTDVCHICHQSKDDCDGYCDCPN